MFFDQGTSPNLSAFTSITAEIKHCDFHNMPQTLKVMFIDTKDDSTPPKLRCRSHIVEVTLSRSRCETIAMPMIRSQREQGFIPVYSSLYFSHS